MKNKHIEEVCECKGKATLKEWDGRIPILECQDCGDTFDAHEDYWLPEVTYFLVDKENEVIDKVTIYEHNISHAKDIMFDEFGHTKGDGKVISEEKYKRMEALG